MPLDHRRRGATRISRVRADTWMFFDGGIDQRAAGNFPAFRHPGLTANFAYGDGHVEALRPGDIDSTTWGSELRFRDHRQVIER